MRVFMKGKQGEFKVRLVSYICILLHHEQAGFLNKWWAISYSQGRLNTVKMEVLPKLIFAVESQNPMWIFKKQIQNNHKSYLEK